MKQRIEGRCPEARIPRARLLARFLLPALLAAAVASLSGCEKSSDNDISEGFDFGNNDPNLFVAMGDSITAGYSAADSYPANLSDMLGKPVIKRGVPGSKSSDGAAHVNDVLAIDRPGYLLILYGINDLIHRHDIEPVVANLRIMVAAAKANRAIPVVATLTPVFNRYAVLQYRVDHLNYAIRLMCAEEGVHVADLAAAFGRRSGYMEDDGLHPNSAGNMLIARTFYGVLK